MLFHSQEFILGFLPVCLAGCFLFNRLLGSVWTLRWLLGASMAFYAWWTPWHLPLLAGSIIANYALAGRIRRSGSPTVWLTSGIALNLAVLGWFKYADFLIHAVWRSAPDLGVTLPLAISFFTFQQIMFLVDTAAAARADPASHQPPLGCYAAFVSFFPHLISGPIVRPGDIIPQLSAPTLGRLSVPNLADGLLIFLLGLGKKLVLADMFGGFADTGFDAAATGVSLTFFEAWYATLAYALQIYFDFSGYSDMALGLARMLNVRFPLNFDSPYQSGSISEFWRRWHITLGTFLRDYLYIPLGGNRVGVPRQCANLMLTMLLAGLWHGAAWTFVVWGALHGLFLVMHLLWRDVAPPLPALAARLITLVAVIIAWVPFRAASFSAAKSVLAGMAGLHGIVLPQMIVTSFPVLAALARPVPVLPYLGSARTLSFPEVSACLLLGWLIVLMLPNIHRMTETGRHWTLTAGFALTVQALFFAPHVAPFLYFQF